MRLVLSNKYKVSVITLSTRATNGVYEDKSGKYLVAFLKDNNLDVVSYHLISDDANKLEKLIIDEREKVGSATPTT